MHRFWQCQLRVAYVLVAFIPAVASRAGTVTLIGNDIAAGTLIEVDVNTGNGTTIGPVGDPVVASLTYDAKNNIVYASSAANDTLLIIDPATGDTTTVGPFGAAPFTMLAIEYDSLNDILYGAQEIQTGEKGSELYAINTNTGTAHLIGSNSVVDFVGGMAFDPVNDILYLSDPADRLLYIVDRTNGNVQLVGPFGVPTTGLGVGLAYDPDLGLFASHNYFSAAIDDELYMINPANGTATLIGPINAGNVLGLTFIASEPECPWDLDRSGGVGTSDLLHLLALWGTNPNGPPDFDGDMVVGTADLLKLLANWGPCGA